MFRLKQDRNIIVVCGHNALKDKCGLNLDTLFGVEDFVEFYAYTPIPHP